MMGMAPADPMLGGLGMSAGAFPSTDPMSLAEIVRGALDEAAARDAAMLEMQQQQAALEAQPMIDQMLMQAAMPQAPMDPMAAMGADPAMAFGEGMGLPPLGPDEMVA